MALPAEQDAASPALPPMPVDVQISPVRSAADRMAFIRFPYSVYRNDPNWVPPLEMERKDFLDPKKNPFLEYADVELFLARRGNQVMGRIAAIKNPHHMEYHGTKEGFFGLFECVNDAGVARALLDTAANWLRERGLDSMLGPANFSSNQDWGLLVEGHETPPAIMMPYNPPYYAALLEACGCAKAKDLWAWELSSAAEPPEKVVRIAEKIRQRDGITVRAIRMSDFAAEVSRVKAIYNAAWEKNWGFIPMTEKEFDHLAKDMKTVVRPELVLIAEVKGEPVAFSMTLPDANEALKAAGGRLTQFGLPIGLVKLLLASRKIRRLRLITLGIKEGYRRRGLDAILYLDTLRTAKQLGYTGGEISWTLEDNTLVNRAIESMGGRRSKTYRVFQRSL
ncbi:N-acetyltransferase [Corallococcus sp. H22C18031201]|uniref:N-acetyltransferase n=1 Tax=Citreicoccus inhibens TaxID=2849499 RepID=UPI000E723CC4|nr:N-acetyltransferase [Citreicoccus inhibens]MBU8894775.1 N-acetyltransferase [Citreicoccus inhibens]RJS17627.1 N-acetyltransferase [Corallococcus sp. H22C18031201]